MLNDACWSTFVVSIASEQAQKVLIDLYRFVEHLAGVNNLHFIIRDRIDDTVIVSFRILFNLDDRVRIEDAITRKLQSITPPCTFALNPDVDHNFHKHAAWPWKERVDKHGIDKFTRFYSFLNKFSKLIVEMGEMNYFASQARIEMAHLVSGMLGCTEYGQLSTTEMRVGLYDRIENEYYPYLRSQL